MYQNTESGGIKHYGGIKDADGNVIEEGCLCRNECKSGRGQGRHALQQKAVQNKQKILAVAERKLQEFEIKILETRAALTQEVADATAALLEVLKDPTSHHARGLIPYISAEHHEQQKELDIGQESASMLEVAVGDHLLLPQGSRTILCKVRSVESAYVNVQYYKQRTQTLRRARARRTRCLIWSWFGGGKTPTRPKKTSSGS